MSWIKFDFIFKAFCFLSFCTCEEFNESKSTSYITDYPIVDGCNERTSGETFNCSCATGTDNMLDETVVFNECFFGKRNGAISGKSMINLNDQGMGMAVYSGFSTDICGEVRKECQCTCFDQASVDGAVQFKTSSSAEGGEGLVTDCLGLCGANCEAGIDGKRYASILVHDICQSFIRSIQPMPNRNDCSDEAVRGASAFLLSLIKNGSCPP